MEGEDGGMVEVETSDPVAEADVDAKPEAPAIEPNARVTLDELFAVEPDFIKAYESTLDAHPVTKEDLERLDPTGRRVVAAMLQRAREGIPEVEAERTKITQERLRVEAMDRLLVARQRDMLKPFVDPRTQQFIAGLRPKDQEPEQFTPEWFEWKLSHGVADRFEKFVGTFQALEKDRNEAAAAAQAEQEYEDRLQVAAAYIDANQDSFDDPRVSDRVGQLVEHHGHTIEQAHQIAMAELVVAGEKDLRQKSVALARERIARGGRRLPTLGDTPKEDSQRAEFYKDNPSAVTRDIDAYNRRRFGA